MTRQPKTKHVNHLPDLITREDYAAAHEQQLVRFRMTVTDEGLEIIGDSPYPHKLEELLAALGPDAIEMILCG